MALQFGGYDLLWHHGGAALFGAADPDSGRLDHIAWVNVGHAARTVTVTPADPSAWPATLALPAHGHGSVDVRFGNLPQTQLAFAVEAS